MSSSRSRSAGLPEPRRIRSSTRSIQVVPSRQGVHWPQDSWEKNRTRARAAATTSVVSSMTITAPEPSMVPRRAASSMVTGSSRCSGTSQGDEAPPGIQAFSARPSRMPPPRCSP